MVEQAVGRVPVSYREIPANSENMRDVAENGLFKRSTVAAWTLNSRVFLTDRRSKSLHLVTGNNRDGRAGLDGPLSVAHPNPIDGRAIAILGVDRKRTTLLF